MLRNVYFFFFLKSQTQDENMTANAKSAAISLPQTHRCVLLERAMNPYLYILSIPPLNLQGDLSSNLEQMPEKKSHAHGNPDFGNAHPRNPLNGHNNSKCHRSKRAK